MHITVRDYDNNVITDEYGVAGGPFKDSRATNGKILWYRPSEYMHPSYV